MTNPPQPLTRPRRRILWRKIRTYTAVYKNSAGVTVKVHTLNPPPRYRTFRAAGGKRRFKLIQSRSTTRKVIIVARSAKKGKGKADLVDEDLEELEDVEDLDDLEEDLEDEDEDEEPEDEDDEDEDEDDEEEDEFDGMNKSALKTAAKSAGIKGYGKMSVDDLREALRSQEDEEDDEEDEDEEDDDEEEEEPAPKKGKGKNSSKNKASRSRTTDGKVGVQEVAAEAGIDGRKLRILLRKKNVEKDGDTGRYEWSSMNNKEVKQILKWVASGAADAASREGLDKLKAKKNSGPARSKSSGTAKGKTSSNGKSSTKGKTTGTKGKKRSSKK